MKKKIYTSNWVERLGQWHLSRLDRTDGRTLCGKPMLGNNWALQIPEDHRTKCEECFNELKELEKLNKLNEQP